MPKSRRAVGFSRFPTAAFDNFTFLYSGPFSPATPFTNFLSGNDDLLGTTTSGFAHTLVAGTSYVFITTGFGNTDFGAFSTTIGGPGAVTPVPEPASYLMLGIGLAGLGLMKRRKALAS